MPYSGPTTENPEAKNQLGIAVKEAMTVSVLRLRILLGKEAVVTQGIEHETQITAPIDEANATHPAVTSGVGRPLNGYGKQLREMYAPLINAEGNLNVAFPDNAEHYRNALIANIRQERDTALHVLDDLQRGVPEAVQWLHDNPPVGELRFCLQEIYHHERAEKLVADIRSATSIYKRDGAGATLAWLKDHPDVASLVARNFYRVYYYKPGDHVAMPDAESCKAFFEQILTGKTQASPGEAIDPIETGSWLVYSSLREGSNLVVDPTQLRRVLAGEEPMSALALGFSQFYHTNINHLRAYLADSIETFTDAYGLTLPFKVSSETPATELVDVVMPGIEKALYERTRQQEATGYKVELLADAVKMQVNLLNKKHAALQRARLGHELGRDDLNNMFGAAYDNGIRWHAGLGVADLQEVICLAIEKHIKDHSAFYQSLPDDEKYHFIRSYLARINPEIAETAIASDRSDFSPTQWEAWLSSLGLDQAGSALQSLLTHYVNDLTLPQAIDAELAALGVLDAPAVWESLERSVRWYKEYKIDDHGGGRRDKINLEAVQQALVADGVLAKDEELPAALQDLAKQYVRARSLTQQEIFVAEVAKRAEQEGIVIKDVVAEGCGEWAWEIVLQYGDPVDIAFKEERVKEILAETLNEWPGLTVHDTTNPFFLTNSQHITTGMRGEALAAEPEIMRYMRIAETECLPHLLLAHANTPEDWERFAMERLGTVQFMVSGVEEQLNRYVVRSMAERVRVEKGGRYIHETRSPGMVYTPLAALTCLKADEHGLDVYIADKLAKALNEYDGRNLADAVVHMWEQGTLRNMLAETASPLLRQLAGLGDLELTEVLDPVVAKLDRGHIRPGEYAKLLELFDRQPASVDDAGSLSKGERALLAHLPPEILEDVLAAVENSDLQGKERFAFFMDRLYSEIPRLLQFDGPSSARHFRGEGETLPASLLSEEIRDLAWEAFGKALARDGVARA